MIHKFVLALVLSLSLALSPAVAHASGGGGGGAGGEDLGDSGAVQKRIAVVLTVILMANVFNQVAQIMTPLNFNNVLQTEQPRLIQMGPSFLSSLNQNFVAYQVLFAATIISMMALLRGARWQKRYF